ATDQNVVAATAADYSAQTKANRTRRATVALAVVVLAGLVIGGLVLWRRGASAPAPSAPATAVQREVRYWITVQKYRDGKPYQDPFRLRDDINFEKDYRIR